MHNIHRPLNRELHFPQLLLGLLARKKKKLTSVVFVLRTFGIISFRYCATAVQSVGVPHFLFPEDIIPSRVTCVSLGAVAFRYCTTVSSATSCWILRPKRRGLTDLCIFGNYVL